MKVGIVGSTGYGGVELYRLLSNHPEVRESVLYSSSLDGTPYSDQYPHLYGISEQRVHPIDEDEMKGLDVVFLATPSGISKKMTPGLLGGQAKVIDLSGDLRLKGHGAYEDWYHGEAAPAEILERAVYGLAECNGRVIRDAELIANPGCFPTAVLLGLYPLAAAGKIKPGSVIIDAKTGLSGAGRKASLSSHFAETHENFRIYKVHEHQHTPEIEHQLHEWDPDTGPITFSTHLVPMTRGIMATIYVELKDPSSTEELLASYRDAYDDHSFVRVRPKGGFPGTKEVFGTNYCDIGLSMDERTGRVTIVSVIDNLMKGAAGQAVQNMNMMFGWHETTGLHHYPIYP
ncbi:N-acetyl-gamma-glutamyl-phosphate reductase [Rossellomorea marisflavi]|uniref:N-acetyl-gamma-glutamyl-phosphate reductase n=1 Tax=Rossellomorea marisflavi TaxID=189381 RepID=UPI00207A6E4D|nr:N-acetyl-gamma-glutamyl-phosphate reductase [Rossellomorea marisflavi]USK92568.1 N-acetyl-gamma-glutamyl-phosphate reductase [Rossellomorea marisflavi]